MGKDYYAILGVSKDADEAELKKGQSRSFNRLCTAGNSRASCVYALYIKVADSKLRVTAAYRKLAMKWHPVSQLCSSSTHASPALPSFNHGIDAVSFA